MINFRNIQRHPALVSSQEKRIKIDQSMFRAPTISMKDLIQQGSVSLSKAFQSFHGCQPGACSLLQQGKGLKK
jgi:hypothetical protein